MTHRYADATSL